MYCSTCGAHVPAGRTRCTTCGAAAYPSGASGAGSLARTPAPTGSVPAPAAAVPHVCRRCGYSGEGVSYFSHGSHIAGLVVLGFLGVMSFGFMGIMALIYYFSYRDHRICPRCGKDWGKHAGHEAAPQLGAGASTQPAVLPAGGGASQTWAVALFVLAGILVLGGIAGEAIPALIMGAGAAGGGMLLHKSARRKREARRQAILSSLQLPVLRLAAERQGRLTVTEVAAALGWTLPRAEKVLDSLDDGLRVSSEVTDEGVIVYEFREIAHGPPRLSGPAA